MQKTRIAVCYFITTKKGCQYIILPNKNFLSTFLCKKMVFVVFLGLGRLFLPYFGSKERTIQRSDGVE